jgi:dethiobiotin synthase
MRAFFVTGTGTNIGKTYVTAGIIRAARKAGRKVSAVKPIISGYNPETPQASDAGVLLDAMGKRVSAQTVAAIAPWRYAAAISPDMAAAFEGRFINLPQVMTFCRAAVASAPDMMLVEGVGGAMVPLDRWHTVRDWIAGLNMPHPHRRRGPGHPRHHHRRHRHQRKRNFASPPGGNRQHHREVFAPDRDSHHPPQVKRFGAGKTGLGAGPVTWR